MSGSMAAYRKKALKGRASFDAAVPNGFVPGGRHVSPESKKGFSAT